MRPSTSSPPSPSRSSFLLLAAVALPALASAALLDRPRSSFLEDVLEAPPAGAAGGAGQRYCRPSGQIQDACCDFETVEQVNHDLFGQLHALVATPYFRYHKVDLAKECPFWEEDGSCMNRACGVDTVDEDHIPEAWRSSTLGRLKETTSRTAAPAGCSELAESDFCVLEDELDSEGVYVDLLENPERFTGYAGPSASRVWQSIYEENCFTPVAFVAPSSSGFPSLGGLGGGGGGMSSGGLGGGLGGGGLAQGGWGESEKRLMGSLAGPRDAGDEVCLEKRVFYRVISGLHASISVHICDDYLDQKTGEWSPNLPCFITRIGQHPERLENLYFTYSLVLRALSRSGPQILRTMADTAAAPDEVGRVRAMLERAKGCENTFDETSMFASGGKGAELLKDEFKSHFRNVSRIMDCVGCDKCRLWGKMQVTGLGTALKLLFSFPDSTTLSSSPSASSLPDVEQVAGLSKTDPKAVVLSRSEVVAFVNTLHRLSESLEAVDRFRTLWAQRGASSSPSSPSSSSSTSPATTAEKEEKDAPTKHGVRIAYTPAKQGEPLNSAAPTPPRDEHPEAEAILSSSSSSSSPPSASPAASAAAAHPSASPARLARSFPASEDLRDLASTFLSHAQLVGRTIFSLPYYLERSIQTLLGLDLPALSMLRQGEIRLAFQRAEGNAEERRRIRVALGEIERRREERERRRKEEVQRKAYERMREVARERARREKKEL
ncbi:hypothetical protein JCM10213_006881 [Rhodosporidiobolus nylandii]